MTRELFRQTFNASMQIRIQEHNMGDVTFFVDEVGTHLIARIEAMVWGDEFKEETVSYPNSWWQYLKRDVYDRLGNTHIGRWLSKKYPVQMTEIAMSAVALYPYYRPIHKLGAYNIQCFKS